MHKLRTALLLAGLAGFLLAAPCRAQSRLYTFDGDTACDHFGRSVAGAGDVNQDGFTDLIVGAPFDEDGGLIRGSARVYSGLDGSPLYTFVGDADGDQFGISVDGAGDVNNDTFDDLVVGAVGVDTNGPLCGSLRIFSGMDGSILYTFLGDDAGDQLGIAVGGAGDVDGDGFDDVIAGQSQDAPNGPGSGSTRVYSGFDGSLLYQFDGDAAGDELGRSVDGAGDVNGDTFDDLIAGAPGNDANGNDAGMARVYSGFDGSVLYTLLGGSANDAFGYSVASAGHVDGDAFADVIVGAAFDDGNGNAAGSAQVFAGVDGSLIHSFSGEEPGDELGTSVAGAVDVNGDGIDDLLAGAVGADRNGDRSGSAYVLSGADGSVFYALHGSRKDDHFGSSVDGAANLNGDAYGDLVVGAQVNPLDCVDIGSAQAFAGSATALHTTPPTPPTAGSFVFMQITGAEPGATVTILGKGKRGITEVACQGGTAPVCIKNAKEVISLVADGNGEAVLTRQAPIRLAGKTVRLQVVEFETCRFSNLVIVTFN